ETPTVELTADPLVVNQNGSTTLEWSSTLVTDCVASGDWSGSKGTSGKEVISDIQTDSTFELSCTDVEGAEPVRASVSIKVIESPPTQVSLSASPTSVVYNGSTTLSWESNADSCTATGSWTGEKRASGSETLNALTENRTYIISCTGSGGTAEATTNVTVLPVPVTEDPVTEEPVTEEPVTEEPVTEEPVTEEPVTEDPVTEDPGTNETMPCSNEALQRIRYQSPTAETLEACIQEVQVRECTEQGLSQWSGSFEYVNCVAHPSNTSSLPRWQWNQIEYAGGFRVMGGKVGEGPNSILAYSPGPFTIDEAKNTIFMVTHDYEQGFGEINIPTLTNSVDPHDFARADTVVQRFQDIYQTERDVTGIEGYFRVTGLLQLNNQLIVNYMNWYDASGRETDTTMIFKDASNLADSQLIGPFQMQGKAHAGGWISPIPAEWQAKLGGTHISGLSQGSIISRLSVGPSAFVWTPENELLSASEGGPLETITALDYSLQHILHDTSLYDQQADGTDNILYNRVDGKNHLWTVSSSAGYAFIIPGTSTYLVVGHSAGHESGLGYKITQDNGHLCGGPCPKAADDHYNYYWLYDVNDMVSVVEGKLEPWEVRPYDYGVFDTIGSNKTLTGAYYDVDDDLLYVALKNGDPIPTYDKPPLFLAYHLNLNHNSR
ncbi:MAG: hypothetical protein P8163_20910, partial [Candidatus Thiodiazotropha sp.]